ncbi:hypothetical protein D3C84_861900 [compost metagenome]
MAVALGRSEGGDPDIDSLFDKVHRGGQLQARVIAGGEQRQGRGGLEQVAPGQARRRFIDRPDTLFLAQMHPVLDHLGLNRVGFQTGAQDGFGLL